MRTCSARSRIACDDELDDADISSSRKGAEGYHTRGKMRDAILPPFSPGHARAICHHFRRRRADNNIIGMANSIVGSGTSVPSAGAGPATGAGALKFCDNAVKSPVLTRPSMLKSPVAQVLPVPPKLLATALKSNAFTFKSRLESPTNV